MSSAQRQRTGRPGRTRLVDLVGLCAVTLERRLVGRDWTQSSEGGSALRAKHPRKGATRSGPDAPGTSPRRAAFAAPGSGAPAMSRPCLARSARKMSLCSSLKPSWRSSVRLPSSCVLGGGAAAAVDDGPAWLFRTVESDGARACEEDAGGGGPWADEREPGASESPSRCAGVGWVEGARQPRASQARGTERARSTHDRPAARWPRPCSTRPRAVRQRRAARCRPV